jgi:hypothetical protein
MATPDLAKVSNSLLPEANLDEATNEEELPIVTAEGNGSATAVIVGTVSIPARLDALTSLVRDKLKPGLDKSLQNELGELLSLIPELDSSYHERFIPLIEIAVLALLSETPNTPLAKGIRKDLEHRVHRSPVAAIIQGGDSPATRVILGLGTLLCLVIPLLVIFVSKVLTLTPGGTLGGEFTLLILVATVGAVGSAVSIMVRIQDFESFKNTNPSILFLTGFFKPIIGMTFALFVFVTLNSGLIPVTIVTENEQYFYAALAFVSGFSERFAQDIATRTEETIVAVQSAQL